MLRISLLKVMSLLGLGYRTVLYCTVSNMQVSLLGVYIGTRNTFTLQRGVRHDQHVLVIWAFVTTWWAPPKIVGVDRGGAGQNLILIHCLSLFPSRSSLRNTYIITYWCFVYMKVWNLLARLSRYSTTVHCACSVVEYKYKTIIQLY